MGEEFHNEMYQIRLYLAKEKRTDALRRFWQDRNQWYLDLVKERRERIGCPSKKEVCDPRCPRPRPNSTAHEIGWLAQRPEFIVDPPELHYLKLPMDRPPPWWKPKGGSCLLQICPWGPFACYCTSYRPKLRKGYIYPPCNCPFMHL